MYTCTILNRRGDVKAVVSFDTREHALDFARRMVSKGESFDISDDSDVVEWSHGEYYEREGDARRAFARRAGLV